MYMPDQTKIKFVVVEQRGIKALYIFTGTHQKAPAEKIIENAIRMGNVSAFQKV